MLIKLDLQNSTVLEAPLHDVGVGRSTLDQLAALQRAPEIAEVLELDQVPDMTESGFDDGGFENGG